MTTKTNDWDEVIEQRVKYAQAWLDTADTQTQDLVFTLLKQKDKETALVVEKERERIENALERINELTDESCRNGLNICPKCASLELVRRKLTPQ